MNHPDNFKINPSTPRPGTGNNLAGAKTPKGRGWNPPELRAAKMFAWLSAHTRAKSESRLVLNCDWAGIGVTPQNIMGDIRRLMPYFDDLWYGEFGRTVPPEDSGAGVINRLRYMYKNVDTRKSEISREHPLRSEKLMPYCQAAIDLFVKGKPVPREVIEELFS